MLFNRHFKRDITQTLTVQGGSLVAFAVLLVMVLPRTLSKTDLGTYLAFRALAATLYPLFTLGLDIAQARYLGYFEQDPERRRAVPATAMISFLLLATVSTGAYLAGRPLVIGSFFPDHPSLATALLAALLTTGLYRMTYTYFQGIRRMPLANLLQCVVTIGGQLSAAALILAGVLSSLEEILWFIALVPLAALPPFLIILVRHRTRNLLFRPILAYAIPRVPHLLANGFLMSSAIILARFFYTGPVVGDIGMASRFFQLIEMLAYAFNMVLLPGVSALWGSDRKMELSAALGRYADGVIMLGIAVFFAFYGIGPMAISLLLPPQYASVIPVLRLLAWCTLPYMVYVMFQYTIHGVDSRPVHVLVDGIRLMVLFGVFAQARSGTEWGPEIVIPASFAASYLSAGVASYAYLKWRTTFPDRTGRWLAHALLVGGLALLSHRFPLTALGLFLAMEAWIVRGWLAGLSRSSPSDFSA